MKYYESKYTGAEVDALLDKVESGDVGGKVTVDSALSTESENPVMNKVITEELNKKATPMKSVTYAELVNLRDNGELLAGMQYRITDYVTTTVQYDTKSAGHQFDLIVLALSPTELSEQARAIQSERDTDGYFANSELSAWQIWYCIDNDTSRFEWVDSENGKGVIYRMIDEHNNDCPYDFKNIQFKHPNDISLYPALYYTFSTVISGVVGDHSFNGGYCYGNKIGPRVNEGKQQLNVIVFINKSKTAVCISNSFGDSCRNNSFGTACYSNIFGNNCHSNNFQDNCRFNSFGDACYSNAFDKSCYGNSFGNYCYSNTFGESCRYNSFENGCYSNTFGESYRNNSFGNTCYSNTFGKSCYYNSLGNDCHSNTFGDTCNSNILGNSCENNSFGNSCNSNSFGNSCNSNSFGNSCSNSFGNSCCYNSFGNYCHSNTFGIACYFNTFDNYCNYNTFGEACKHNSFAGSCENNSFGNGCESNNFGDTCGNNILNNSCESNTFGDYCRNNSFGNSCKSNSFGDYCDNNTFGNYCNYNTFGDYYETNKVDDDVSSITLSNNQTSLSQQVQNYHLTQGLNSKTIEVECNRAYQTTIAVNSSGNVKQFCIADIIQ